MRLFLVMLSVLFLVACSDDTKAPVADKGPALTEASVPKTEVSIPVLEASAPKTEAAAPKLEASAPKPDSK